MLNIDSLSEFRWEYYNYEINRIFEISLYLINPIVDMISKLIFGNKSKLKIFLYNRKSNVIKGNISITFKSVRYNWASQILQAVNIITVKCEICVNLKMYRKFD